MAAELPARTGVNGNTYSCIFGFKQLLDFEPELSERVEVQGTSAAGVPYVDYYFMTGTNVEGMPVFIDSGSLLDVTPSELGTYASNTGNLTQGVDPFTNFPFEKGISGERKWHPVKHYCNVKYSDAC